MIELIRASFEFEGTEYHSEDKYAYEIEEEEEEWDEHGCEECCKELIKIVSIDYPENNLYLEEVMDYQEMVREAFSEEWEDDTEWD